MSGLVSYTSSDEDEDIQPEKPAKIQKLAGDTHNKPEAGAELGTRHVTDSTQLPQPDTTVQNLKADADGQTESAGQSIIGPALGPAPGPFGPPLQSPTPPPVDQNGRPLSPFSFAQMRRRELTMPGVPNFSIPDSPPGPSDPDGKTQLATTTKKFTRFLELKKQGVHFNERLQNSTSLRNPSLLPKLMEFAGIGPNEEHASTLAIGGDLEGWGGVPSKWPREWYFENLVKENARREKKRARERTRPEFVSAKSSAQSSGKATPEGRS
ncbi:hypothetical protein K431DRAFT_315964 [Polychaeton citri CBS 116435]|uniref:HCNGP-domain-containing protein n=1 Tax=Polychaeton citri CBS 116435 TaxID=1314669 RepID=A0A9P4PY99_9PEZI|nr:hypothetical protein K431DRAFT_315964 [Polychaeton citri CBS 116435]